jgi:DNA-directed RNA polymerase specialized sigma24 family protein
MTGECPTPLARSDEALWQASARGDQQAFSELYERHAQVIYNYLFRRLADWSEAEDLTAVVFLEAFRQRRDVVVVDGKLVPWLYGIATNVLRNRRRAQWRHRRLVAQLEAQPRGAAEPDAAARAQSRRADARSSRAHEQTSARAAGRPRTLRLVRLELRGSRTRARNTGRHGALTPRTGSRDVDGTSGAFAT